MWNLPLGDRAVFAPASLFATPPTGGIFIDTDFFVATSPQDPAIAWYSQGHWNSTPNCELFPWSKQVGSVPWPANLSITEGGNNALALCLPDGDSMIYTQPAYRCGVAATPLLSLLDKAHGTGSLRGNGDHGGHGGSALNAIGGSLRAGELLPTSPGPGPRHVLKVQLWAKQYYYGFAHGANWSTCYRYPALVCDGYADNPALYGGANPKLTPGALLAVPQAALPALLASLRTPPARALAWTLATYGALLCDDTYADRATFNAEAGFAGAFGAAWGFPFEAAAGPWFEDVLALWRALMIVDSNSAATPGGGGAPLAPPPPPFCA